MQATPTEAIRAIKDLLADPENVAAVLSALSNAYGDWLAAEDLIGHSRAPKGSGYGRMLDAFDEVEDFSAWLAGARKVAA